MQTLLNARKPPALSARQNLAVNRKGRETIYWPLYDTAIYPAAGITELNFFQNPIGQQTKTLDDTNMSSSGQLPANQSFIVTGVSCMLIPNSLPSTANVQQASSYVNDLWDLSRNGFARLFIGSKDYIQMAPIGSIPSQYRIAGFSALADARAAGANQQSMVGYAAPAGEEHKITPLDIPSNQNFNFSMHWPTLVTLVDDMRVIVYLNGWLTRNSQ